MDYDALEPEYLKQLDAPVLLHSATQYQTALEVIRERPTPLTDVLVHHLERCLEAVTAEIARRDLAIPESESRRISAD